MNKAFIFGLLMTSAVANAQQNTLPPPPIRSSHTTTDGLKNNAAKSNLVEKQIADIAKFKYLTFQVITGTDLTTSKSEKFIGICSEFETYDWISKKTLTMDKAELAKLIDALQNIYQKEGEKSSAVEKKYKFLTASKIEFGAVFNDKSNAWINYIDFPQNFNQKYLIQFSKSELNDLIKILKTASDKID